ncbi:unnamed protein product [Cuscuta campestris]|uniref:Endonuclease/exonuclease/phosphatase domain-containing protein n=1 Tax=Cuscuta campestris TaxID=132261 RepID=A0A484KM93_9ASTE|nr:unnamed protein product [Cuscuta campestris]
MAWGVVGDFNCLLDPSEKKGGRPYAPVKYRPFVECVEDCELVDSPFIGEDYTWFNNRVGGVEVRSRLDRLLFNQPWMDMFSCLVHHLDRVGSDHAPLLVECKSHERPPARPFTFLNVWTEHEDFQRVVADSSREDITGSPMFVFGAKLKRLAHSLKRWNRDTFGHIFDRLKWFHCDVRANAPTTELAWWAVDSTQGTWEFTNLQDLDIRVRSLLLMDDLPFFRIDEDGAAGKPKQTSYTDLGSSPMQEHTFTARNDHVPLVMKLEDASQCHTDEHEVSKEVVPKTSKATTALPGKVLGMAKELAPTPSPMPQKNDIFHMFGGFDPQPETSRLIEVELEEIAR